MSAGALPVCSGALRGLRTGFPARRLPPPWCWPGNEGGPGSPPRQCGAFFTSDEKSAVEGFCLVPRRPEQGQPQPTRDFAQFPNKVLFMLA